MIKLVKAEMYKLFKGRTFKVLACIALGLGLLVVGITQIMNEDFLRESLKDMPQEQQDAMLEQLFAAQDTETIVVGGNLGFKTTGAKDPFNATPVEIFHTSFGSGVVEILFTVLVAAMVAKEYSDGTIKNALAYGKKREHFYLSKFIANLVGATILVAIMVGVGTIGRCLLYSGPNPFEFSQLGHMIKVFAGATAVYSGIIAIMMLLATLLKSNGSTIGVGCGIFIILPTMAAFLYGTYDWYDKIYELTPFYNSTLVTSINATTNQIMTSSLIGIVTCILALVLGIAVFKKQDIK